MRLVRCDVCGMDMGNKSSGPYGEFLLPIETRFTKVLPGAGIAEIVREFCSFGCARDWAAGPIPTRENPHGLDPSR